MNKINENHSIPFPRWNSNYNAVTDNFYCVISHDNNSIKVISSSP